MKDEWQITGPLKYDHPVYRFFPHKTKGEGFFLAALRKADGETEEIRFKNKNKKEKGKTVPAVPEAARAYLLDTTSFTPEWSGSTLWMLPEPVRDVYPLLREHLRILSAGICIGETKGKDFIPAEELALSTALCPDAFPVADLDWDDAIRYLKKATYWSVTKSFRSVSPNISATVPTTSTRRNGASAQGMCRRR